MKKESELLRDLANLIINANEVNIEERKELFEAIKEYMIDHSNLRTLTWGLCDMTEKLAKNQLHTHYEIFTSEEGYKIFIKLKELLRNKSIRDYAYIFRKLQHEGYIWKSLTSYFFQLWLKEYYKIDHINKKYHTLDELGESRINDYEHALLNSKQ